MDAGESFQRLPQLHFMRWREATGKICVSIWGRDREKNSIQAGGRIRRAFDPATRRYGGTLSLSSIVCLSFPGPVLLGLPSPCLTASGRDYQPAIWAEDGTVFFYGQITSPGVGLLFQPYAGYLHVVPGLVTVVAALFHADAAPLVMNPCALVIAALCCSLLSLNRYRYLLHSDWLRIALCLVITTAFHAVEFIGTITCVHCFLFIGALLIALQPPEAYTRRHAWTGYLTIAAGLLSGLSEPAVVLFLPLALWIAIKRKGIASLAPGAVALATLIQIGFFLREPSHAGTESWVRF